MLHWSEFMTESELFSQASWTRRAMYVYHDDHGG